MKILKEEFGEKPISEWLAIQVKQYHEKKYGEDCEIIIKQHDEQQCS